jgi:hypothetical protein
LFVHVHMSLSSKLVPDCVLFITTTFNLSSQRLCTRANTLPARGLPRARCPRASSFFRFFSKKSDNFVETNRTRERFFKRKLELAKGKDDSLRGMASRYSLKLLVLTPLQLRHEDLRVLLLSPIFIQPLFKSLRVTARTPVRKNIFTSKILAKLSPEPFQFPRAANRWFHLVD